MHRGFSCSLVFASVAFMLMACSHTPKKAERTGNALTDGKAAIQSMTGCYLVDYSYVETEALKKGYQRDNRVYDVNKERSVKEWIFADEVSPQRVRLQHILFATEKDGKLMAGSELKHQAEDWEYEAPYFYEFTAPSHWQVTQPKATQGTWVRRITNLDDGLRYQCVSAWDTKSEYPTWTCDNYSPIPGRETRDMKRKDYQALQRSTKIVVYGTNWLERQNNVKTIHEKDKKTPLAKEEGKNWYVRLDDKECKVAQEFSESRKAFWALLRESWDEVFTGTQPFVEKSIKDQPPRYAKMMEVEAQYLQKDLGDSKVRAEAKQAILKVIADYREPSTTSIKQ